MAKYYVICSGDIGGAEKRFVDVFMSQVDSGMNVEIVLPSFLIPLLFSPAEISRYAKQIVDIKMEKWRKFLFVLRYLKWFTFRSNSNYIFHYPLNPIFFAHLFGNRKFVASFCDCTRLPGRPFSGTVGFLEWGALLLSDGIDVLSPKIYGYLSTKYPRKKISLTPGGTFVRPMPRKTVFSMDKLNVNIAFVSRLAPLKGVELFLEVAELFSVKWKGLKHVTFSIYGEGILQDFVVMRVGQLKLKNVDIKYLGYMPAHFAFGQSDIVCSLQEVTNYPSRVVAEALLCGCEVIISNTGDSNDFGELIGLHYVPSHADSIYNKLSEICLSGDFSASRVEKIMKNSYDAFHDEKYLEYMFCVGA